MKFDKPEHKEIIKQLLAGATYPGDMVKQIADLMDAVERAEVGTETTGHQSPQSGSGELRPVT